jgi:hypothetical protein
MPIYYAFLGILEQKPLPWQLKALCKPYKQSTASMDLC